MDKLSREEEGEWLECRDRLLHKLALLMEELPMLRRFEVKIPRVNSLLSLLHLVVLRLGAPGSEP